MCIVFCFLFLFLVTDPIFLIYLDYAESPYYKFVRDTLSYLFLLALHFALCLEPSTKRISGLEWTIFVFFAGRYLVEGKQIMEQKSGYFRYVLLYDLPLNNDHR